ncbi:hypothetical protein HOI71_27310, partial [Candidatus Poribacteria bacterium]|nr:hypothetical protein [Candidatus Poribacteria bacterium]
MTNTTTDRGPTAAQIADRLDARRSGEGWIAKCPAHDDNHPSLSIGAGDDGTLLLHCFAGCGFEEIARALNITRRANGDRDGAPEPTYTYCDAHGEVAFGVVRLGSGAAKAFRQVHPE